MKSKRFFILFFSLILSIAWIVNAQTYNYADALQKSIFFFECQRSGQLPADNRVNWRGPSALTDGSDVSKDLTGGWYDAGDNVKFNFPMAFSATAIAWGAIDFKSGYEKAGQLAKVKESLRWVNDYLIKCHTAPNEFYGQVGNGGIDHAFWGASEIMQMARPSYKIDATKPGSDLAAEAAAAMAAASIVFKTDDPAYSATLLNHAKQLYEFADKYRGKYSDAITDATAYYNSWSGYKDELVWGAAWLYRATNDVAYLTKAETEYANLSNEGQSTTEKAYKWATSWDDKGYACYVLMAQLTGKSVYETDAERHLDYWINGLFTTPGGLRWLSEWGPLRYAANTSFLALLYSDYVKDATKKAKYKDFAISQINYALGSNPDKRSFVCGFGNNSPKNPHHRTAHGGWQNNVQATDPVNNRHTIYGALVGGPDKADKYIDDRNNYYTNEIACDYNACFQGATARLAADYNSAPTVIVPEAPSDEYFCDSKINMSGSDFFEPAVMLFNHSAWPAKVTTKLSFKYFIDITEGVAKGKTIADYSVKANYVQGGTISALKLWTGNIYYCELSFTGEKIYPGGQSVCRREAQFRFTGPAGCWDNSNDPSSAGIIGTMSRNDNIAVYDDGVLVGGKEPGPTVTYDIVSSAGIGGVITPTGTAKVNKGSNKTYSITPNVGFKVSALKVDGTVVTAALSYTFSNVTANHSIEVTFASVPTYTINASVGAGGSISPNGATTVSEGSNQTYTITGNSGYKVSQVTVDGVSQGSITTYTFSDVKVNHTISATFVTTPVYAITAVQSANGSITPAGVTSVNEGGSKTFTITPTANYKVSDVRVNGISVGAVTSYTIENVLANTTITAIFQEGPACTLLTLFGVPRSTALPAVNTEYGFKYTTGIGAPALSNVSKFSINWDLANKGLYVFAVNTSDGKPDWYISLLTKITHNFDSPSPAVKITGSGITGLDGDYWVNMDGADFVMVAKDGSYAICFNKVPTTPKECLTTSEIVTWVGGNDVLISPNPVSSNGIFKIDFGQSTSGIVSIYNSLGSISSTFEFENQDSLVVNSNLTKGIYFVRICSENKTITKKIIVK